VNPAPGYISTDEETYLADAIPAGLAGRDLLPVYLGPNASVEEGAPFVYFDSRTYFFTKRIASDPPNGPFTTYLNFYQMCPRGTLIGDTVPNNSNRLGSIRPLVSNNLRSPANPAKFLNFFMEDSKFQVIGPGIDERFGGRLVGLTPSADDLRVALWRYPTGDSFLQGTPFSIDRWRFLNSSDRPEYQLGQDIADNAANFSERTFEVSTPPPG